MINQPIYCITSDLDWASDYCIEDFLQLTRSLGVIPTLFATHDSPVIRAFSEAHPDDVGVHPNFRSNSSHGTDISTVIDHVFRIYPAAKTFRSHGYFDSSDILQEMAQRGVRYDSNLCLYLQPGIVPLQLGVPGITRLPVFWEDDTHWLRTGGDWKVENYLEAFTSPGLKIIDVHPFITALNIPSGEYYRRVHPHITTVSGKDIESLRHQGSGARTFLIDLVKFVKSQNQRFYTLHEIYRNFPVDAFLASKKESGRRQSLHTDAEYASYWKMTEADRQEFLKESYNRQRDAKDKYATSRDYHARELEIQAVARSIKDKGSVLDLGCGNGYTLISLAKQLTDWKLVGVDFSENLIEGARHLAAQEGDALQSTPEFVCADATRYIASARNDSVKYVISERFIQNLPSTESQERVMREIYRILEPGGRFLMCEGSQDGFQALNELRSRVGLSTIPETSADNVSAIRIESDRLESHLGPRIGFKLVGKLGFSQYFVISRVLHPLMVAPMGPRFDSRFNFFARLIQENMEFDPGLGSNVLWIFEK
jgi:ubiquinone/menaquinone biosynthesis C-methylase UbiE